MISRCLLQKTLARFAVVVAAAVGAIAVAVVAFVIAANDVEEGFGADVVA